MAEKLVPKEVALAVAVKVDNRPPMYVNMVSVQSVGGQLVLTFGFMHPTAIDVASAATPSGPAPIVIEPAVTLAVSKDAGQRLMAELQRHIESVS